MPNPKTTTSYSPYDALMILYSKHHKAENMGVGGLLQFTVDSDQFIDLCVCYCYSPIPDSVQEAILMPSL